MFRKFAIAKEERALLLRKGAFVRMLYPGTHRFFDPFRRLTVERFPVSGGGLGQAQADLLRRAGPLRVERDFHEVSLPAGQMGLVYQNGALAEVLAPGARRLYWKGLIAVRVVRLDIAEHFALAPSLTLALGTAAGRARIVGAEAVFAVQVPPHHVGRLYVDERVDRLLQPGLHAFWKFRRQLRAELVDLRLQPGLLNTAQASSTPAVVTSQSISRPATNAGCQLT